MYAVVPTLSADYCGTNKPKINLIGPTAREWRRE
jgi:hypothetical protein